MQICQTSTCHGWCGEHRKQDTNADTDWKAGMNDSVILMKRRVIVKAYVQAHRHRNITRNRMQECNNMQTINYAKIWQMTGGGWLYTCILLADWETGKVGVGVRTSMIREESLRTSGGQMERGRSRAEW